MVLGVRAKSRRSPTIQLEYLVHVQEVKPWPPSQSLKSLRSVLIRWENGERNAGSTKAVVPDLGSGVLDGKIEFDESFRIPVTLVRDMSVRGGDGDAYQKNYLEFNLYEPRRDKTVKGQLIGTAIIDLAAYGGVKESVTVSVPVNSKRSFRNTAQPLLVLKIRSAERGHSSSSSRNNLMKEASMDRGVGESVSALMNEEYAEEAETASMTDDDVSSHSSLAVSSSAFESNGGLSPHSEENGFQAIKDNPKETYDQQLLTSKEGSVKFGPESVKAEHESPKDEDVTQCGAETNFSNLKGPARNESNDSSVRVAIPNHDAKLSSAASVNQDDTENCQYSDTETTCKDASSNVTLDGPADDGEAEHHDNGRDTSAAQERPHPTNRVASKFTQSDTKMSVSSGSDELSSCEENTASNSYIQNGATLKNAKSVRSSVESFRSYGSVKGGNFADFHNGSQSFISNERKDDQVYRKETRSIASESRIQQLESKLKMLEGELREAAAIEVGLYSVVAEHGSSITKLHAPARRLSRLYLHACKESSQSRRGHAARSAVSGLVLVAKACGNDVPRLTFWLSNSIVLRAIISRASTKQQSSPTTAAIVKLGGQQGNHNKPSSLKWKDFSPNSDIGTALSENSADWNDPHAFTSALEKIEAWIFSRIIESVWWQTLTPHMQSAAAKSVNTSGGKTYRACRSDDQEQVIFSLELWKKAFKDACERLCPVRAAGHDCGCLPILAKLIMEQCVARLDVAMFNAILRESGDEIPTDPISDPVTDAKVLPIQAGKASFGAGAQLKNAIGNWSRWLTDLFGIDDDAFLENEDHHNENDDDGMRRDDTSSKCFRLLNALSDLMMLPKDMLLSKSIRKEVCPTFAAPMIRRVLDNFVPDEFCPDMVPGVVLEALESEDPREAEEGSITNFPCTAAPIVYSPPPAASVAGIISNTSNLSLLRSSGSSVLKKSHTSDDELEEFESPLAAIINSFQALPSSTKPSWTQNENGRRHAVRYQLLREVWMNSE